jgi:hypothetical protein
MAKQQLFLSHAWGPDIYSRDNHARVVKLSKFLNLYGWTCWLDDNEIYDNIDYSIINGINNCQAVLICLTLSYFQKINKAVKNPAMRDSCLKEWTFATASNKILIPIIMEKCLLNKNNWPISIISLYFGYTFYVDLTNDNYMDNVKNLDKKLKRYKLAPVMYKTPNIIRKQYKLAILDKLIHSMKQQCILKSLVRKNKSTGNLLKIAV